MHIKAKRPSQKLPPFSPMPKTSSGVHPKHRDYKHFSKTYNALPYEEKSALIMQTRREWYAALTRTGVITGNQAQQQAQEAQQATDAKTQQ